MKKVALEAWEKNKDKIRKYIENHYKDFNPLDSQAEFLGQILNIAYKEEPQPTVGNVYRPNIVQFKNIGKFRVMLFLLCTKGGLQTTTLYTKYSILSNDNHPNISIDEKCYIAQQIVLSATPIDIVNCSREWREVVIDRKWAGFVQQRGIITHDEART